MAISQVVAAKTDGSTYNTVPPNVSGSGSGGNGGSVAKASNSSLLDGVVVSRYSSGVFGSTVLDNNSADKALSAGTFAYNNQRPVGKRVSSTINGLSNDVLLSGAAQPTLVQSIHKIESVTTRRLTTAIRAGYWNIYSGTWSSPVTVGVDSFGTDDAANPTRDFPGELQYMSGSTTPTLDEYKAKTN